MPGTLVLVTMPSNRTPMSTGAFVVSPPSEAEGRHNAAATRTSPYREAEQAILDERIECVRAGSFKIGEISRNDCKFVFYGRGGD
jgi:hypothetical protein